MSRRRNKFDKPKNFKKTWVDLFNYLRSYIPLMVLVLVFSMLASLFQVLGPNKLKELTDVIAQGLPTATQTQSLASIDMGMVREIVLVLVLLYVTATLIDLARGFIMATMTQKISKNMRSEINDKITRLPMQYFDKVSYGDVLSRITNDVDIIGQTMNQSIVNLVSALTMFIGTLVMMFYNSWVLALTALISTSFGFVLMFGIIRFSQKYFILQQENLGDLNGHIEESYSGHHVIKAYNAGQKDLATFRKINDDLKDSAWKSQFLSGLMQPLMQFIGNFGYVAVSIVGASLALKGHITFGVIVAFMTYIRLFTQPLSQIAQSFNRLQSTAAAAERVFEFLNETEEKDESHLTQRLNNVKGNVKFNHVSFGYLEDELVIKDFNDDVKSGEKIAIVGPTGAGKTTLVNLLMRFYEINEGEILIDDINISDIPKEDLRKQFSMVLQDTWIFEGTISDNVRFNQENISEEMIIEASQTVGLDHFIQTLPEGYNTKLSDTTSFSEGQKQLLTIARAIIKDAPILILDEATSSVDTRTERLIQEAMDKLSQNRTSFVIAHRLSTIKDADKILVIDEGEIVEKGTHDELLHLNGFYHDLYYAQFEI